MYCPHCGNSAIEFKQENSGKTVALCKNCGTTWDPNYVSSLSSPSSKKKKKPIYKRVWFWIVIGLLVIGMFSPKDKTTTEETTNNVVYEIKGGELGEYGRKVILNENTDFPIEKYLYKLPAGIYEVTTSTDKMASFFIVKDEINYNSDNLDYPEELNYVAGETYLLTAGNNDFNGHAKKSVIVELAEDESFQIVGTDILFFEKIK